MRDNIVDLIILLARRIRLGEPLQDIKDETLHGYNKSEISAAYSWILQKYEGADKKYSQNSEMNHRVLHFAERMLIAPDAYGYLLELVNIGILDPYSMENIIEKVMFQQTTEKISLEKIKQIVQIHLFENDKFQKNQSSFLRGNESVN